MKLIKFFSLIGMMCLLMPAVFAQETTGDGQICIRSFEDRNGNGSFDPNEPLITQGIGVNLLNASNITIDAKLLEDSPNAAQGVVCFQQLLTGDYVVVVTSPDYTATTPTTFNAFVLPESVPTRFDFGGTIISTNIENTSTPSSTAFTEADQQQALQGILFGLIGAIVVMGFMLVVGVIIYFGVFQRRMNRIMATQTTGTFRPVTGPMPAVQGNYAPPQPDKLSTDSTPPVRPNIPMFERDPNEGSPPLFDDTDEMEAL